MDAIAPMTPDDLPAAESNLLSVREKADAYCLGQMRELAELGRAIASEIRGETAAGRTPSDELLKDVAQCRAQFVLMAVRGAVLAGRWPEADEPEAYARCADDDGLYAFLDEIARIPAGFVDPPITPVRRS